MSKSLYCLRFYKSDDDVCFTIGEVTTVAASHEVQLQILPLDCNHFEGMANLYHAHFTLPLNANDNRELTDFASRYGLEFNCIMEFCAEAAALARGVDNSIKILTDHSGN